MIHVDSTSPGFNHSMVFGLSKEFPNRPSTVEKGLLSDCLRCFVQVVLSFQFSEFYVVPGLLLIIFVLLSPTRLCSTSSNLYL